MGKNIVAFSISSEFAYKFVGCCNLLYVIALNNIKGYLVLCSAEVRCNGGVDVELGCYLAFAHHGVCAFFGLDVVAINDGYIATFS